MLTRGDWVIISGNVPHFLYGMTGECITVMSEMVTVRIPYVVDLKTSQEYRNKHWTIDIENLTAMQDYQVGELVHILDNPVNSLWSDKIGKISRKLRKNNYEIDFEEVAGHNPAHAFRVQFASWEFEKTDWIELVGSGDEV